MSVIGIDFGNDSTVLALTRRGGVDIVLNEVSNRATPSIVSFGEKERFIGEAGLNNLVKNYRNSVTQLKRLLGLKPGSAELEREKRFLTCKTATLDDGRLALEVNYAGEQRLFTPEQVVGMLFHKLRDFAERENQSRVLDAVVSVPAYFTENQRRALLDAAAIGGLNTLRIVNENVAAAIEYGIYKQDLPDKTPVNILIVDVGHSAVTASVVAFVKGKLTILSSAFDRELGSRDLDAMLADHFAAEIQKKHRLDVNSNPKARLRLFAACEKVKKTLSANSSAQLSIESLMDDIDVRFTIQRTEFEEMAKPLFDRMNVVLQRAVDESKIAIGDIAACEVIGSASRTPALKRALHEFFGRELSTTLNTSEAVARGCAIHAAMLSPNFKVRSFEVNDVTPFGFSVVYAAPGAASNMEIDSGSDSVKRTEIFHAFEGYPSTKAFTVTRSEDFAILAQYNQGPNLPAGVDLNVAKYIIHKTPETKGQDHKIKSYLRLNLNGVLLLDKAEIYEEIEEVEPVTPPAAAASSDTPMPDAAAPPAEELKKKTKVKRTSLQFESLNSSLSKSQLQALCDLEATMYNDDRVVQETADRRNAVESYVYDMRSRVSDGDLSEFVAPADKTSFAALLDETENWLYGEGEDANKSAYVSRLKSLTDVGAPMVFRYNESSERPHAARELQDAIAAYVAATTDEKFSHLEQADLDKISKACGDAHAWLAPLMEKQNSLPKTVVPVYTSAEVRQRLSQLQKACDPIFAKPKPAPAPTPAPPAPAQAAPAAAAEEQQPEQPQQEAKKEANGMDLD